MSFITFAIFQVIILVGIIIYLKQMIFSDTNSALNRLSKLSDANRGKEQILNEKIEEAQKFIDEQKEILAESEKKMKQEAKRAAGQLHEDIIKKAKVEADDIIQKAQETRQQMEKDAQVAAETKMIAFCNELVGNVLSTTLQADLNERIVDGFLSEIEKADWTKVNVDGSDIEVISSQAVAEAKLNELKDLMSQKIGRPMNIAFKTDPSLVAGIQMRLGSTVVDGTLKERLEEAAKQMKDKLVWA